MEAHNAPSRLVVIGLGYVGLPLVIEAVGVGLQVVGLDSSERVVEDLIQGRSHVDDVADADVSDILSRGFVATTDASCIATADVVVICVPTPLDGELGPNLDAVQDAARHIAKNLQPGQLVVLESTTYPGTTEEVLVPILETSGLVAGQDFHVAYSPERIDPGNRRFTLRNTPKVVGGITPLGTERAVDFYSQVVDEVVVSGGVKEAEMTKLLENTYRHINIALVNEMAQFCAELEIDLWDAIRCASTKPFGFSPFFPGPGVGGHCIPIDPNYLSHRVQTRLGYSFRFVELAQEINAGMPAYVVRRIQDLLNDQSLPLRNSRILLLGVTYKADIGDVRESPAEDIAKALIELGARVSYIDPLVDSWAIDGAEVKKTADLSDGLREAHVAVLLQAHSSFDHNEMSGSGTWTLDTRGVLSGPMVVRL
ncbi:MAG TPA: nucleotide sugar dehydrogenase [Actinobacteria bacterium]|nr:nucleotide sugar dehydrogenase [Actinomycetota bacterium]